MNNQKFPECIEYMIGEKKVLKLHNLINFPLGYVFVFKIVLNTLKPFTHIL